MGTRWVVVAESAKARIFSVPSDGAPWEELADLVHTESRQHGRDLTSDTPGRAVDREGATRHPMAEPHDPKAHEAEVFAMQVAQHVESARRAGQLAELVLVAEPRFLGTLRGCLSTECRRLLVQEVGKHLTQADPQTIAAALAASS